MLTSIGAGDEYGSLVGRHSCSHTARVLVRRVKEVEMVEGFLPRLVHSWGHGESGFNHYILAMGMKGPVERLQGDRHDGQHSALEQPWNIQGVG